MRKFRLAYLLAALCLVTLVIGEVKAQRVNPTNGVTTSFIPAPEAVLGFTPGDDRKLASWHQVLAYFEKLDQASDRVKFEVLGRTTLDAPFVLATISAPENLARLDGYRKIQDLFGRVS